GGLGPLAAALSQGLIRSLRRAMPSRRRNPLVAVLAAALPILLILGIYLGGHPEDLPGFARDAFVADHQTRVVSEAINRISRDYYRPVAKDRLTNASIAGAVASLK